MNKAIYYLRLLVSAIVLICCFLAFTTTFSFFTKFFAVQLGPGIASLISSFSITVLISVISIIIFTFLFGRFYCSLICPLGILQNFIGFLSLKNSKNYKNMAKTRYTIAALVFGALFCGWAVGFKILDPYTNFGLIASSLFTPVYSFITGLEIYRFTVPIFLISLMPFVILVYLVLFKRRFFCTAICPVGTALGLFAKYGIFRLKIGNNCVTCGACFRNCPAGSINLKDKKIDNELCIRCLRCVAACPKKTISFGTVNSNIKPVSFNQSRRNFILGSVLVLGAFATGIGSAVVRGKKFLKDKIRAVLPPGAGDYTKFSSKCTSCQLCVAVCPNKVIHPRDFNHSTIYMDYSRNFCKYDCNTCSQICPTGAIEKISLEQKQHTRIGLAKINRDLCINCGICAFKCPVQALNIEEDSNGDRLLKYNAAVCIGCGACQIACPHKAIEIVGIVEQSKTDL